MNGASANRSGLLMGLFCIGIYLLMIAMGAFLLASFTYFPMRDNYRKCGSVMLCDTH